MLHLNVIPNPIVQQQPMLLEINPNYPTANNYKQYSPRTHVYMKPDTWVGSDEKMTREEWLFDVTNKKMVKAVIDFVPGCERIFVEIISNASDNVGRSRRNGVDPGRIDITMDNTTISVTNYGMPIPIEMHETGVYVPQMIFGTMLTSSNYEVDRHEAGTNGVGAKATNIFSKSFTIIVHDHIRHLKYTQIWSNNMKERSEPKIEQYRGTKSSVQIIYVMDFERFKYTEYPPEAFSLFARHAVDTSFTAKVPVTFNGHEFNMSNIRDYARLYYGDAVDTAVIHYQWPPGTEVKNKKRGYQVAVTPGVTPEVELIALDTPDEGHHVSFVNCMMTRDGGVHTDAAIKAIGDTTVKKLNDDTVKKLMKQNKGKELDAKEKRAHTITIADVKPHISVLISVKVVNPKFTSQSKTQLTAPTPKITITEDELKIMGKWELIDRLYAALEAKQFKSLSKTDGKSRGHVKCLKGDNANRAGKTGKENCILYITEGKSGAGYAYSLRDLIPNGNDYIGVLPFKGKSLNAMKADHFQIQRNEEIKELKKMLGLTECLDPALKETYYLDDKNFSKLRYGGIMIMADADVDGKHITGLIINYFYCQFPSLLARGYIMHWRSPILRTIKNKQVNKFYSNGEYEIWKNQTPDYEKWTHKYYKGLGTSKEADIKDDLATARVVRCLYDDKAPAAIKLAFHPKMANQRKDWMSSWKPVLGVQNLEMQPISDFINNELIEFSLANSIRAIPKLMDGFKESLRKIMYGVHLKWKIGSKKGYTEYKLERLAAFIAEKTIYHHGTEILSKVMIGMTQDFVGANNIPWFEKQGQYGSRRKGGSDAAAARYPNTNPHKLVQYILRKEDQPILKHMIDEGEKIEPETYYPIIPMILVNGVEGVATGWSTYVPCHNPLDLVKWLRMKLNGATDDVLPPILPWYRGYTGVIKVIDRRKKKKSAKVTVIKPADENGLQAPRVQQFESTTENDDTSTVDDEDDEYDGRDYEDNERPLLSMVTIGNCHIDQKGNINITELPIGKSPKKYKEQLEKWIEEKKLTTYDDNCVGNTAGFTLYGFKDEPTINNLRLKKTYGMSNMVLLDETNKPVRYDTAFDIMESFYVQRLRIYQLRKDYIISAIQKKIINLGYKIRFIQAILNKQIKVKNVKKTIVYQIMDQLQIPHEIYDNAKLTHLSEEDIIRFKQEIVENEQNLIDVQQKTIEAMWLQDLDDFEKAYRSHYSIKEDSNVVPQNSIDNKTLILSVASPNTTKKQTAKRKAPTAKGKKTATPLTLPPPVVNTVKLNIIN